MELGLSGLASGFDWRTLIDQLSDVERAPQRRLLVEQSTLQTVNNAYASLKTELAVLQGKVDALKDPALFGSRQAAASDATVASATAAADTPLGSYAFSFLQLATASVQKGAANVGSPISPTNDVSGVLVSSASFATALTAGTFTVNGKQVTIATSDSLQQVFDAISAATSGAVTASYNAAGDNITLSSAGEIVLGSATDTSNFLQAARLSNNGSGTVTSAFALGSVRVDATLATANFGTTVSDGGSGAGEFKINGVSITFNAATDKVSDVLQRINDSTAGVTASYDSVNDRFILTNRSTGDMGIALSDVTGNFLAASGLTLGAIERGQDLLYTVNGGGQLTSHSNSITSDSHGIAGLTVNALKAAESTTTTSGGLSDIGYPSYVSSIGGGTSTRVRTSAPHGLETGHAVRFESAGTLPSQLQSDTMYYVRRTASTDLRIYNTAADAAADTNAINFGSNPSFTGDIYLTRVDPLAPAASTTTTLGPPATTTIDVTSDTTKIKTAITDFIAAYNKAQSFIDTQTASTTDAKGKVTAGVLQGQSDANEIASRLRSLANSQLTALSGSLKQLASLGIDSNGNDNSITLADEAKLDAALANNLTNAKALFTDTTSGIAVSLSDYLDKTIGEDGTLLTRQNTLAQQSSSIDTQIADLERMVLANRQRLIDSFITMELAQQRINQQLQFLQQRFGASQTQSSG